MRTVLILENTMTTFLTVPFAEKDQAKHLGARWNAEKKKWYVPADADITPFKKWLGADTTIGVRGSKSPPMEEVGLTLTGADYVERAHDCVPWLPCEDCDGR